MVKTKAEIATKARSAIASDSLVGGHAAKVRVSVDTADTLTLEGALPSIAAKKRALRRAAAVQGVAGIIDRLRVEPAAPMGDGEIGDHLTRAYLQESAFQELEIIWLRRGEKNVLHRPVAKALGSLSFEISDGVVVLDGSVPGLDYKRLAGLLAWWVPGVRDVINAIAVDPEEEDRPELIEDAVRLAFEKDRLVNESQIRVGVRDTTVRLTGLVSTEAEREMAESDAWAIFGVDDVINHIEVRRPAG